MQYQTKQVLFSKEKIENIVKEIVVEIQQTELDETFSSNVLNDYPVFICVLNGAFMFFADIVKHFPNCYIDFIRAKSYAGINQHELKILSDIETDIKGKRVYLIDDIYDSGKTIDSLISYLNSKNPTSITPITLFSRGNKKLPNDGMVGVILENETFLVGYGLDNNGLQRTQPYITGIEDDLN